MGAPRGRQASPSTPPGNSPMHRHPLAPACPATLSRPSRPVNHRPAPLRLLADEPAEAGPAGELARSPRLAWLEAALMAADEPLAPRKLAALAGLATAAEARALAAELRELYEREGGSFQVEEIA